MTVVVAFLCSDGVVIAADSMMTPSMGGINVGHHKGQKISLLAGQQICAFAGDQGQAMRFMLLADINHAMIPTSPHALSYPLILSNAVHADFKSTNIADRIGVNAILSFPHNGEHRCCVFEGAMQPRMLDAQHYYVALGSGKLSADPFLRFMVDTFCQKKQPSIKDAVFLACWTVQHAVDTSSGGVDGPIRIAIAEHSNGKASTVRELTADEIQEHGQAVESAAQALRKWRDELTSLPTAALEGDEPPRFSAPSAADPPGTA